MLRFSRGSCAVSTLARCFHQIFYQAEAAKLYNLRSRKFAFLEKSVSNFYRTISYRSQLYSEKPEEGRVDCFVTNECSTLGSASKQLNKSSDWTTEMDEKLYDIANKEFKLTWKELSAKYFPQFTAEQLKLRYYTLFPSNTNKWSYQEISLLKWAVLATRGNWMLVSRAVGRRSSRQCYFKWEILTDPEVGKTPWTEDESEQLVHLVLELPELKNSNWASAFSAIDWEQISASFTGKSALRCKTRFIQLMINSTQKRLGLGCIKAGPWSSQETSHLHSLVYKHKFDWREIAKELNHRLPSQCRKHWYDLEMKRLEAKI